MKKKIYLFLSILFVIVMIMTITAISTNNSNKNNDKIANNVKLVQTISSVKVENDNNANYNNDEIGSLTIEKIGMSHEKIKEGVNDNILKNNIGHFSNTPIFNGNVCFAGHNYSIKGSNLFKYLNRLKIGDIVIYETMYGTRQYKVLKIYNIKSTDFSVLDNSEENALTFITCIGNRKDIRLYVKAIEYKGDE